MSTKVTVTFMTRHGVSFTVRFYVPASIVTPDDPIILAIITAIEVACACVGISIEITLSGSFVSTAGTGPTIAEDKLVLVVPDDSGENHIFKIPAPKLAAGVTVFAADGTTLDMLDAAVTGLSAALVANGYGQSGDALTAIKKGHRAGGKRLAA